MTRRRFGREEPANREPDPDADPEAVAREIVLRQLTTRARSRAELEHALQTRGVPDDVAASVLNRFEELALVDDAGFAEAWAQSRQRAGRSVRVIRQELRTKGVGDEDAAAALDALAPDADYLAALAFARKRVGSMRALEPNVRYRRLGGALARRGFSGGVTARVLREVLAEHSEHSEHGELAHDFD